MQLTRETLFKPVPAKSGISPTDMAVRSIAGKEAEARLQKTARLRALRLAKEAELAEENSDRKPTNAGKGRARRRIPA